MLACSRLLLSGVHMNWGGDPGGTGTGARRSGGFAPAAGGGGAGRRHGWGWRADEEPARPRAVRPAAAKQSRDDGRLRAGGADFGCGRPGPGVVAPRWRSCWRGRRDARAGFAGRAAHFGLPRTGRGWLALCAPLGVTQVGDQDAQRRRRRRQANQRGRQRRPALADRQTAPWAPADRPARRGRRRRSAAVRRRSSRPRRARPSGGQRRCATSNTLPRRATRAVRRRGIYPKRGPNLENRPPSHPDEPAECEGTAGLVVARASALLAAGRRVGRAARQRRVDAPPGRSGRSRSQASTAPGTVELRGAGRRLRTASGCRARQAGLARVPVAGRATRRRSIASAATIAPSALKKKPIAPGYPARPGRNFRNASRAPLGVCVRIRRAARPRRGRVV